MALKFEKKFQTKALIDLTPLIDLVFLLVAFFMITSSLKTESVISVDLPEASQTKLTQKEEVHITIDKNNQVFVNDLMHDKKNLLSKFLELKKNMRDRR